jgi:hypothetical protein
MGMYVCTYVLTHVCMYLCTVYTVYVYMYVFSLMQVFFVCMYVCTVYVCMYVCMHIFLFYSMCVCVIQGSAYPSLGRNFSVSLLPLRAVDQNADRGRLTSLRLNISYFSCGFKLHDIIVTGVKEIAGAFGRLENLLCTNEIKLLAAVFFCLLFFFRL